MLSASTTLLTALLPAVLCPGPGGGEEGSIPLKYKSYRKWQCELPSPTATPVGSGISFTALGLEFAAARQGTGLAIDTDGDGETDVVIEGEAGFVTLRGKSADGTAFTYAARLQNDGDGWCFAGSGALVGELDGTRIQLLDQDNNGSFADFGVDAMIVGRQTSAAFLSRAVNVGGKLYEIDVAADGSSLSYRPYEGESGELDLRSALSTKAELLAAIVQSVDGRYSFDLAKGNLSVPAGSYRIHSGKIGLGEGIVRVRTGRSEPIEVATGKHAEVAWGGPTKVEFTYQRRGGEVVLDPARIWYYGAAGEEYFGFSPRGKSPVFTIVDAGDGTELASAILPGSC